MTATTAVTRAAATSERRFYSALGLAFPGFTDLFVLALVARRPALTWPAASGDRPGGALIVASQPLRLVIGGTGPWLAFARWATG